MATAKTKGRIEFEQAINRLADGLSQFPEVYGGAPGYCPECGRNLKTPIIQESDDYCWQCNREAEPIR